MRTTIRKVFWAWEFDKGEKWLNEMTAAGQALCGVGWCRYEFEPCQPGEYEVRLQLLENDLKDAKSVEYLSLLEETGAVHVGSWMRWVYLRKRTADGPFELFSDNASRAKHLSVILALLVPIMLLNLFVGFYNVFLALTIGVGINYLGFVNLILGALCAVGYVRLRKKKDALEADRQLFE